LFDAVDAQEVYDDEALRAIIYPNQKIQSRKFSELKNYLYELILKSLQGFDEKSSYEYKLKGMLLNIKVLFKRSHFDDCIEMMQKAKKLAAKYEAFEHIVELLAWEKKIAYAKIDVNFMDKELDRIQAEEKECLGQLAQLSTYRNIFFKVLTRSKQEALMRSEDKVSEMNDIMSHPLLENIEQANSHRARVVFYRIKSIYHYVILDYDNFYFFGKKLDLNNPIDFNAKYISALSNFTYSCTILNKYDEVNECLDKFLKINALTHDDELKIHRQYYQNKFNVCSKIGTFDEGLKALNDHLRSIEKFNQDAFNRNTFYLSYFYIYFGAGDFDKALENLNEWLSLPKTSEREDLQSLARVLNLIIHYEMGNNLLLESLLRSTYRFLSKRNRLYEFEKSVLGFIQKSGRLRTSKELREAFVTLKNEFENLAQIPSEDAMLRYFNFTAWLESKIEGITFAEAVQADYQRNFA
jgi:tetratricopeptide (TPR) repeat protein